MNNPRQKFFPKLPSSRNLSTLLHRVVDVLLNEDESYRPSFDDEKGSLLEFNDSLPIVIVPDLHARYDFFKALLDYVLEGEKIIDLIAQKKLRLIFLGDGLHTELNTKERWVQAYDKFLQGQFINSYIKKEMAEGLALMTEIMRLKISYPFFVHFLKGNHENILNEESYGNSPFGKFVMEGEMVKAFMLSYYGKEITEQYANFEYLLPLFIIGKGYLISHAEPERAYTKKELIEAKSNAKIVRGLTWTKNDQVSGKAVVKLLERFQKDFPQARYFSGHRIVENRLSYRAEGKLVQIHDSKINQFVYLKTGDDFNPKKNLIEIQLKDDI